MAEKPTLFKDVPATTLLRRFKEAEKAKEKYNGTWARNMRLWNTDAWNGIEKIAWFQSEPQYNKVFEFVETMRGFLSDNKWGMDVIPASIPGAIQDAMDGKNSEAISKSVSKIADQMGVEPRDTADGEQELDLVDLLNVKCAHIDKLLDFEWSENRMQSKLAANLMHVFLKGTGITKAVFDPENVGDSGIGQIETTVVDPTYFYPDPDATNMYDGDFYIEKHPVSVRWVLNRYPKNAAAFLESIGASSMDMAPHGTQSAGAAIPEEGKRVDILECWYKDTALWDDDQFGVDGKLTAAKGSKKYPKGRYTIISDKGIPLEDKANEYGILAPYARTVEIEIPGEFWGGCTVDKAASLQLIINQLMRSIIDNGLWMVHGIWIADSTSGVDADSLAGYGMRDVVVKSPGSEVRRDVGEPLPHTIFQTLEMAVQAFDRVVNMPDILRGIAPSRQPVQTTQLQLESGEVRTRERSRRVEEGLEDLAKIWLDIVANCWVDKRSVRTAKAVGGFDMFQLSKDDLTDWRFDMHVRPGSTAPMNRQEAFDLAKSMRMELQIPIPDDYFVRNAQLPGLEASVMQANKEAQEAAEQPIDQAEFEGMEEPEGLPEGDQFPAPGEEMGLPPELAGMQLP